MDSRIFDQDTLTRIIKQADKRYAKSGETSGGGDDSVKDTVTAMQTPFMGRDLTEIFADEIAEYDNNPWQWIKARINAGDFSGMTHGDYIPMWFEGEQHEMQINIDTYYVPKGGYTVNHHIDFISRDCPSGYRVQWNENGSNNGSGSGSDRYPYMSSTIKATLNDEMYPLLPDEVKEVITSRYAFIEYRYSSSGYLDESNSYGYYDIGKLWVPDEFEVFGRTILATPYYSDIGSVQYPVFAHNFQARCKGEGPGSWADGWWLRSVYAGDSDGAVYVDVDGLPDWYGVDYDCCVPLCFRIAAD